MSDRWTIKGDSIFFHYAGVVKHVSFSNKFKGKTYSQAKRIMDDYSYTSIEKKEIKRFLRELGFLRETH